MTMNELSIYLQSKDSLLGPPPGRPTYPSPKRRPASGVGAPLSDEQEELNGNESTPCR